MLVALLSFNNVASCGKEADKGSNQESNKEIKENKENKEKKVAEETGKAKK